MHQALYRRFRPETFEGVLGQEHIKKILQNQIRSEAVGHAYLFCGTRGTGKTTLARILAKGVNCIADLEGRPCGVCENCIGIKEGVFLDVIEIDAASNNGVENIRELRESVKYAPVKGRYKVYIIDEVHMLSSGAFNALLKTLEEPPEYVMFILATTEPQKLPATILSRCMRLDFRRVPEDILLGGMQSICNTLDVNISEGALRLIAANGDGSVRDSLSLLDQCITGGGKNISRDDVLRILGMKGEESFVKITQFVLSGQVGEALVYTDQLIKEGIEVRQYIKDWIGHYRNLMITKFIKDPENVLNLSEENTNRIKEQSKQIDIGSIDFNIRELAAAALEAKWSTQPRILMELAIVKMATKDDKVESETIGRRKLVEKVDLKTKEPIVAEAKAIKKAVTVEESQEEKDVEDPAAIVDGVDNLWEKVMKDAIAEKASLGILGRSCSTVCIDGECIRLCLDNELAEKYVEDNKDMLSELLKRHSGSDLKIDYILGENNGAKVQNKPPEVIAKEIGTMLNIKVEVE